MRKKSHKLTDLNVEVFWVASRRVSPSGNPTYPIVKRTIGGGTGTPSGIGHNLTVAESWIRLQLFRSKARRMAAFFWRKIMKVHVRSTCVSHVAFPTLTLKTSTDQSATFWLFPCGQFPRGIPDDPNARRPKISRRIYQDVEKSLLNQHGEPGTFHLKKQRHSGNRWTQSSSRVTASTS